MGTLARLDPADLPMPRSRGRALTTLAAALTDATVRLDRSVDREETRTALMALPGIGPWTADYVSMRALGDPDVFLPTDVGVRNAATRLGSSPDEVVARSERWRPWRSYALMQLWSVVLEQMTPPMTDQGTMTGDIG
jgi:AraC family transcriptional regulator of adaptative response / DNA-3-methyladenine glycosylase II